MTAQSGTRPSKLNGATSSRWLLTGAVWTVGAFGVAQILRLATSIILTRLLAPELFGIMQIVNSLKIGIEMVSDVGIGQNIIYNKDANEPDFYDTAWTLQAIRGAVLGLAFCLAAYPISRFYDSPVLGPILVISSLGALIGGLTSTSRFLLQKRMKFGTYAALSTGVQFIATIVQVALVWVMPNIWSLVLGSLFSVAAFAIASHFVLPDVRQRFQLRKSRVVQILSFGKWIFASSVVYFLSTNFDRLYFAKTIPLELLGIYGIARALSEMAGAVVLQLGNGVIFPFISAHSEERRDELRAHLAPIRLKFVLLAAFGFSVFAASSDIAVKTLYDQRYEAATWMLPLLVFGAWFTVLANINESSLLGLGRPNFNFLANAAKFIFLMVGMMLAVPRYGVLGGVLVVAASDLSRYVPILVGQTRERFSFFRQDVLATAAVIGFTALWVWLRALAGFGVSFEALFKQFT